MIMHPHDPDLVLAARGGTPGGGGANDARPFTMPADRPGYGKLMVIVGFVAIAGLVGQSLFRRWRWTTSGTGRIEIAVSPDDAVIKLDADPPRRSPATAIVRAGGHTLVIERDGYVRVEQQIEVNPGETVEVPVSLMAIPPPPTVARPAPARPRSHHAARPSVIRANGVSYVDVKSGTVR